MNLDGLEAEHVSEGKVLGITLTEDLKWNDHISDITAEAARRLYLLRQLRTVPTIVTAHTFCASPHTRISYRQCLLIQGYFCAV